MRRSLLKLNGRHLPKALRQALVLFTLLILPSAAWGQATITVAGNAPDATTGNITGEGISFAGEGSVNFVSTGDNSGTLTLNNATINGAIVLSNALYFLTIDIIGTNTIQATNSALIKRTNTDYWSEVRFTSSTKTGSLTLENVGGNSDEGLLYYVEPSATNNLAPKFPSSTDTWATATKAEIKALGITVAGVTVTTGNSTDILDGDNKGKVSFTPGEDSTPGILTLNNATISGNIISKTLTINLERTNTINGSILLNTDATSEGTLAFTGTGSLEMTGQNGDCPVKYFENVTIGSGLYLQTNEPGTHWDGQRFSANGSGLSTLKITSDVYYPIWVIFDGVDYIQVSGENKDHVLGESNTAVTYDSDNDQLILNNFVCATTGGEYAICLGDQEEFKIHILGENRISGGGVSFANEVASLVFSTDAQDPGTLTIVQPQDGYYPFTSIDESEVSYENGLGYTDHVVSTGWTRLIFGGTPITGTTQTVGDYTGVSFDASTNTLTLNGADITVESGDAIVSSLENLTIFLVGDQNVITCGNNFAFNKTSAIDEASITFTTDATSNGSLTIGGHLFGEGVTPAYTNVSLKDDGTDYKTIDSSCGISVGGVDVTEFNKNNVLSTPEGTTPTVSFTPAVPATDTTPAVPAILTLNGATIEAEEETAGIAYDNEEDLRIALIGNNSVRGGAGCMAIEKRYGTETPNLSFAKGDETKHFSLTLLANTSDDLIGHFETNYGDFFVSEDEDGGTFTRTIASSIYGGTGSEDEPFLIKTPEDLKNFADDYNRGRFSKDAHIQLFNTIDCKDLEGFTPIAKESNIKFCGVFDGNDNTIKNLTISSDPSGLFGFIGENEDNSAMIQDLTLDNCKISGGKESGAIVANMYAGTVQSCTVVNECKITTRDAQGPSAGGIVGYINSGLIDGCKVQNSSISSTTEYEYGGGYTVAGGIAGRLLYDGDGITISNCEVSSSTITANDILPDGMGAGGIYGGYEASNGSTITITGNEVKGETQIITIDGYGGSVNYSVYNGAIGSTYDENIFTLSNNTYEYTVTTSATEETNDPVVKNGYTQRGIGGTELNELTEEYDAIPDIIGGAELANTTKLTIDMEHIVEGGPNGYYEPLSDYDKGEFYLVSGQETTVSLQTEVNYSITSASLSYTGADPISLENTGEEGTYKYTFTMPDANATLNVTGKTDISNYTIKDLAASTPYTGAAITPTFTVVDQKETELASTNYTVSYQKVEITTDGEGADPTEKLTDVEEMVEVGSYKIVVTGTGEYGGSKSVDFEITKANLNIVTIEAIADQTYTGSAITLEEVTVKLNDKQVSSDEYEITGYSNNTNVSTETEKATVTITATASSIHFTQSTTQTATFNIVAKALTAEMIEFSGVDLRVEDNSFIYNGQNQKPTVTVTDPDRGENGTVLEESTDYDIENEGGTDVGEYTVTITGKGNYGGSASKAFSITAKAIATEDITVTLSTETDLTYDGTEKKPAVTKVEIPGNDAPVELTTEDYDADNIVYENNINAGENTATVTVTLKGNYSGTGVATFSIEQADLQYAAISKIAFGGKEYTVGDLIEIPYTGEAIQPTVEEVTFNDGKVTVDASDYNVSYSNNTEISSDDNLALIIITSTGKNFTEGTSTSQGFKIVRATVTITAEDQTVTYNADKQEYDISKIEVSNNNAKLAITYYAKEADRSNGENALEEAPTNADTYYVRVTLNEESQQHYVADPADATFTIDQLEMTNDNTTITLDKTELTYNGEAQTVNVTKVKVGELVVPAECYEVSDNTATEAGTYTAKVTAKSTNADGSEFKNNFKGSATIDWKINHRTASAAELGFTSETQTASTYYNPNEDFNLPEGYVGYIVTGINGTNVLTTRVSYIQKGVAVLVEKGSSSANAIDEAPDPATLPLKGTSEPLEVSSIAGGTVYVLYNGEFVKSTSGTIPGKRCYLLIESSVAAGTRAFGITHNMDANGIDSALFDDNDVKTDDKWFNLQGRRIEKPTKAGIYVVNGKKVMINNK